MNRNSISEVEDWQTLLSFLVINLLFYLQRRLYRSFDKHDAAFFTLEGVWSFKGAAGSALGILEYILRFQLRVVLQNGHQW